MSATSSCTPGDIEEKRPDAFTYVVQRGDTLAGVALRLGVKQSELKRANHMYGSKTLVTGQVLKVHIPVEQAAVITDANAGNAAAAAAIATAAAPETAGASPAPRSDVQPYPEGDESTTALRPALAAGAGDSVGSPAAEPVAMTSSTTIATASNSSGTVDASRARAEASAVAAPQDEEDLGTMDGADHVAVTPSARARREEECVGADGSPQEDGPTRRKAEAAGGGTDKPELEELVIPRASRQPSDASAGVSIRNAIRYVFSPSPSAASRGAGEIFPETSSADVAAIENTAILEPPLDEPWPVDRESRADSTAQLPPRSAREASDASSTMSTAQTLLAMVTPRAWLSGEWGSTEDGERAGTGTAANGDDEPNGMRCAYEGDEEGTISGPLASDDAGGDVPATASPSPSSLKLPLLIAGGSTIVTHSTLARMELALSKHYRGYNWHLLFSTYRDGASYTTMYSNIKQEEPTYVVVESMNGEVFGGFAARAWSSCCQYYGTGENFLFKIKGERTTCDSADASAESGTGDAGGKAAMNGEVMSYTWTGMNMYMQYSDCAGLGMGGGGEDASFGLFIGEDFINGSTGRCNTFNNPPLCSRRQFQISQVEVWGFTTAETEMNARLERLRKTLRGRTTRPL